MARFFKIILGCILFVLFFQGGIFVKADSGTNVSGIINQDTTWTLAGSPYYLTGDIQIANGVKLTVEPGVIIEGNNNRIRDFGDFEAIGNSDSKITLKNVNIVPGAGSYNDQFLIHIEHTDMLNGSLYSPTGNAIYGSLILKDSRLFNLSSYLYLWYPTSDVDIERNVFINSGGISVGTDNGIKVNILNNVFYNYKNFAVENWACYGNSETNVSYNSFLNPNNYFGKTLVLPAGYSSTKMTATNNYWGTTDEAVINNMIFDKNDDLSSASYIDFKPFLQAADPNTPVIDTTAPEKPIVDDVTEKSDCITGKAEPLSVINVVDEYNNGIGNTKTDENGNFNINILRRNAGSKLYVTATDDWLNTSNAAIVIVKDVTPPTVPTVNDVTDKTTLVTGTAEAGSTVTVKSGTSIVGTAIANSDGTYSVPIVLQKPGTKLTVTATDGAGNVSIAKEMTVKDTEKPVILGATSKTIVINSAFNPKAGVTAKDNVDGDLTSVIKVTGIVNTRKIGTYSLSYSVIDKSGNLTIVTRKITVIDNVKPVISGALNKTIKLNSKFNSKTGITVWDNVDGNLTSLIKVTGNVNTKKKGTYSLNYTVTDKSGNKTVVVRKITVK